MNINYGKEVLTHNYNYIFIGIVFFLMFITSSFWGWIYLLGAAELLIYASSFTEPVQRLINTQSSEINKKYMKAEIDEIFNILDGHYTNELKKVKVLYHELVKKDINNAMGDKLIQFYYRAATSLRTIQILTQQNSCESELKSIATQIKQLDIQLNQGTLSAKIKSALQTNRTLLTKRYKVLEGVGGKVEEIKAEVAVIRDSLALINTNFDILSAEDSDVNDLIDELLIQTESSEPLDVNNLQLPKIIKEQNGRENSTGNYGRRSQSERR